MKTGISYSVIGMLSLEEGIVAERREVKIPNDHWVINEAVMTGCGSQPIIPRIFAPQPSYRHVVTTVSQDTVFNEMLGISFLTINEGETQFRVLVENVLYHSSHPFFIIVERVVQLPKEGTEPYARRHLIMPRQVRGGELGEYPGHVELKVVRRDFSSDNERVCLSELARVASVNPDKLAEDFLWPPFLEVPRGRHPFIIAERASKLSDPTSVKTPSMLDLRRSLVGQLESRNWANMVWVALPLARAILHLKNLHFEVGDRAAEVPLQSLALSTSSNG
jgi:hypothetical protein